METKVESATPKRPADEVLRAYSPQPAVRRLNRAALAIIFLAVALLFAGRTVIGLFHRYAAQIADDVVQHSHPEALPRRPRRAMENDQLPSARRASKARTRCFKGLRVSDAARDRRRLSHTSVVTVQAE